jgi:hypothetical protein
MVARMMQTPITIATNMAMVSNPLGIKIFRTASLLDDLRFLRVLCQIFARVEIIVLNISFLYPFV